MLSKLVRNEHRKLTATGCNALAVSAMVIGVLQPIFGGSDVPQDHFRAIMALATTLVLHLLARAAVDQLEE
ncbi:MAG TPA: hypothetical protein VG735_08940 [Caulobacterales bacterium]|nr:hypothetical protein [Caulobacterales bacterium]